MHRRVLLSFVTLALLLCNGWLTPVAQAQEAFRADQRIPDTATAVIIAKPKAALATPAMELVPRELITAFGKREFNVDICEISQVTLVIDSFEDLIEPPGFALTIEFDSDQTPKKELFEDAEEDELNGKPLFRFAGRSSPVAYLPNARTVVLGMESFVEEIIDPDLKKGKLAEVVASSDSGQQAMAYVVMDPIRDFIDENLPPKDQLPFPIQPFRDLPDNIESIQLSVDFATDENNRVLINAIDDDAAKKIMKTIEQGLTTGRGMLMTTLANEMSDQPEMLEAIEAYDERVGDKIEDLLKPEINGKTLTYTAERAQSISTAATIGTLVGMLLPAVQQVRGAARRTQSMNNMRQIAIASLNYESAYMKFPQNICDEDGNPLLSWRVAILPFIEQNALYQQFHLDEPWDSEHNIELLDQMPMTFISPSLDTGNKTPYLGFEGEGTIFDPEEDSIGFGQITDGSSNTILVVEANEDAAIEWTRPMDIEFDPDEEATEIGSARPGGFLAALCDGSTHMMSNLNWETIKNLIQINDGNVVNW